MASVGNKKIANEADLLVALQETIADKPGVLSLARGLSHFGEHALGWIALGAVGALVDSKRRADWVRLAVAAVIAHAISVVVKRVVRRKRPHDERIRIGVSTPSKLSFPSSHATSTSAALVSLAKLSHNPLPLLGVPVMMISRMVLGVHYPTDVLTGAVAGAATAEAVARYGKAN